MTRALAVLLLLVAAPAFPLGAQIRFADATDDSGVLFRHEPGACGYRYFVEQIGGGVVFEDFDGDGALDLVLLSGHALGDCPETGVNWTRYFRGDGRGTFTDATLEAGLIEVGYAIGGATGDYDADGDPDLFVTCFGPNRLYRNDGGRFVDVAPAARVADPAMSTGCAFLDFDGDGHLDLYVANYVLWDFDRHRECRQGGVPAYCLPQDYRAVPDRLYRGNGSGEFEDVTVSSGVLSPRGRGFGVATADYDGDGRTDVFVANDATDNALFHNSGGGQLRDVALVAGVALSDEGAMENGMGVAWGDVDGDGRLDVVVTNYEGETHTISRNLGDGFFEDISWKSRTGKDTFPLLGWGVLLEDFDLDGRLDIFFAHGHVFDNVAEFRDGREAAQPNVMFRGEGGGLFARVPERDSPGLALRRNSRGAAAGDIDNDGDLDIVVSNWSGRCDVLRNDTPRSGHWLGVRCLRTPRGRSALGARVTLRAGGRIQVRELSSGGSFLSQSDPRALFGLGAAGEVDALEVRWPGGRTETFAVPALDRYLDLVEGKGESRR